MTRLIDGVSSVSRPVVAGSFSDSSNISFAATRHRATGTYQLRGAFFGGKVRQLSLGSRHIHP